MTRTPRPFLDLDGVLADFDGHYARCFGVTIDRSADVDPPNFWKHIKRHGRFYRDLPLMPDALELFHGVRALTGQVPTILTGIPQADTDPHAAQHKREWVTEHFSEDVPVICCESKDKRKYGRPGDILIDDWHRYRHLWEEMGGIFILHVNAATSLEGLARLLAYTEAHR